MASLHSSRLWDQTRSRTACPLMVPRIGLVTTLIAGACISPVFEGFYNFTAWGPLCIGALVTAIALVSGISVASKLNLPTLALTGAASLCALAVWARLSTGWADAKDAALIGADRWVLYAAVLLTLVLVIRDRVAARSSVTAIGIGVVGFAGYLLVRMLSAQGAQLLSFGGGRLNLPIGYVPAESGMLLLGVWPLIAHAERMRGLRSGLALAGATMLVAIAVLGQSRSTEFAAAGSAVLVLILVPGRLRRFWALVVVAGAVTLFSSPLLDVYRQFERGGLGAVRMRPAALAVMGAAVVAGAGWVVLSELVRADRRLPLASARVGAVVALVLCLGVTVAFSGQIEHTISRQWHAFTSNSSEQTSGSRFAMGGGNRHEYWRVALKEFSAHPLSGVGAGNYEAGWMRLRHITEDITQPHSLEFQTLAELGLVGTVPLLGLIGAVLIANVRLGYRSGRRGRIHSSRHARLAAVGGGGTFVAWLLVSSVDWLHLFPGPTALGLVGAAVVLSGTGEPRDRTNWRARGSGLARDRALGGSASGWRSLINKGTLIVVLVVTGVVGVLGVARPLAAQRLQTAAHQALADRDPASALADVRRAESIDSRSLDSYYLAAAAYALRDEYGPARASLLHATQIDPSSFSSWLLLGDIAVRHGDLGQARRAYARAHALDPRETTFNGQLPDVG